MIPTIRTYSQQLAGPSMDNPVDLVKWMGAVQAQEYTMAKWALGIRLQNPGLSVVQRALDEGKIVRTHVMRPTWHFVAGEDIRWMLKLSGKSIRAAIDSYEKHLGIPKELYWKVNSLLENILSGTTGLTKQEIGEELAKMGITADASGINSFLTCAENDGLLCSGMDKGNKITYALLEERVAPAKELTVEECLEKLATRYFQSHSPAGLRDFVWWSGLSVKDSRYAIDLIRDKLIKNRFAGDELFIHECWNEVNSCEDSLHFLPSYDEYLISYKDRSHVLLPEHFSKAYNNYGIFYPVIWYNGKIVGNWKRIKQKKEIVYKISFFDKCKVPKRLIKEAEQRYEAFLMG